MTRLLLALLTIGALMGCAAPSRQAIAGDTPLPTSTIQAIDAFVTGEMARRHMPGLALAVVTDGRIRYAQGYGFADLERRTPVRVDTPFLIASITKMFTAVATMMLVQDGKLRLDAPVGDYLTGLPAHWQPLTVRQLLTHTSGLNSHTAHDAPPCGPAPEENAYTPQDVIAEIACLPLDFPPGTDWSYSDTGYVVLGLVIEQASGVPYEHFLRQRIFTPLGMTATHMMGPPGADDGRATGYSWMDGKLVRGPALSPVIEGAAGGLVSTVADLARFDGALAHGTLLPASVLAAMWRPVEVGKARYGIGFGLRPIDGRRQAGHTGGGPSAANSFARFLDDNLTVIVLTNAGQPLGAIQDVVGGIAQSVLPHPAPGP